MTTSLLTFGIMTSRPITFGTMTVGLATCGEMTFGLFIICAVTFSGMTFDLSNERLSYGIKSNGTFCYDN